MSFNQLNRKTGHGNKYLKVDADSGEEVASEDFVKADRSTKRLSSRPKEELDNVALESTRTFDINEFVDRSQIDPHYPSAPTT